MFEVNGYFIDIDLNKSMYTISKDGKKLFNCSLKNPIEAIIELIEGKKGVK